MSAQMREWASCFKISPAILGISNLKLSTFIVGAARSVLYIWLGGEALGGAPVGARRENEWKGPFIALEDARTASFS